MYAARPRSQLNKVPPQIATTCGWPLSFTGISVDTVPCV